MLRVVNYFMSIDSKSIYSHDLVDMSLFEWPHQVLDLQNFDTN